MEFHVFLKSDTSGTYKDGRIFVESDVSGIFMYINMGLLPISGQWNHFFDLLYPGKPLNVRDVKS